MNRLPVFLILFFVSRVALASSCATDELKALVGSFNGVAAIVTVEDSNFKIRSPKPMAPTNIENQSSFALAKTRPCENFDLKIDYLNPQIVQFITGEAVAREVKFSGVAENDGSFSLLVNGVKKGDLHKIDGLTFMARFDAPNPLDANQQTFCKEFISLTPDLQQIVRTIQCFSKASRKLVQYRLVKEQRNSTGLN
jgi:hypothetical protein